MKTINSNKKILVTGGAGYVGSILVRKLLKKGYQVRIIDALYWGKEHLKELEKQVEIIKADIRNFKRDYLKDIDGVIHQAALSNDPMADFDPQSNFQINSEATVELAVLCKKAGIKRFTFASSASIYDRGLKAELSMQDESSIVNPKAAYSLSKHQAEKELIKLADDSFCPVIFRTGTVYGFSPKMRYDLVVNTMVKNALQKGEIHAFCGGVQWRPLIDVNDVAEAHILGITAPTEKARGQIFNLVYKNYQIKELAEIIKKVLKKFDIETKIFIDSLPRKDRSYKISGDKITKTFGWQPKISVEESIKKMVKEIKFFGYTDFDNPKYYNIEWMKQRIRL